MAEAAEKRAAGDKSRGVKDPGSVKRMEERRDELERRQAENVGTSNQPTLRVSLDYRSYDNVSPMVRFNFYLKLNPFTYFTCSYFTSFIFLQWTQG